MKLDFFSWPGTADRFSFLCFHFSSTTDEKNYYHNRKKMFDDKLIDDCHFKS